MKHMSKSLGKSKEDYLEAILMLQEEKSWCREIDIAAKLGFSRPSVSIALSKLEVEHFITRENNGAIALTDAGMEVASKTLAKHRTLKKMLQEIGVEEEKAEDEACLIEHSISDDTFAKMKQWLKQYEAEHPEVPSV